MANKGTENSSKTEQSSKKEEKQTTPVPEEEDDTGFFQFGSKFLSTIDLFAYAQHGNWGSWYFGTPVGVFLSLLALGLSGAWIYISYTFFLDGYGGVLTINPTQTDLSAPTYIYPIDLGFMLLERNKEGNFTGHLNTVAYSISEYVVTAEGNSSFPANTTSPDCINIYDEDGLDMMRVKCQTTISSLTDLPQYPVDSETWVVVEIQKFDNTTNEYLESGYLTVDVTPSSLVDEVDIPDLVEEKKILRFGLDRNHIHHAYLNFQRVTYSYGFEMYPILPAEAIVSATKVVTEFQSMESWRQHSVDDTMVKLYFKQALMDKTVIYQGVTYFQLACFCAAGFSAFFSIFGTLAYGFNRKAFIKKHRARAVRRDEARLDGFIKAKMLNDASRAQLHVNDMPKLLDLLVKDFTSTAAIAEEDDIKNTSRGKQVPKKNGRKKK